MLINILRVGVRRMGPDSFQWCPVTGQGAVGTNWSIGISVRTWGRTLTLRVKVHWSRLPRGFVNYPSLEIFKTCLDEVLCTWYRWTIFSRGVGLDDPQRSLRIPTILWFCDSWRTAIYLRRFFKKIQLCLAFRVNFT